MGLTGFNTKAHIVRAALEAAAFQVKELIDAMDSDLKKSASSSSALEAAAYQVQWCHQGHCVTPSLLEDAWFPPCPHSHDFSSFFIS